MTAGNLTIQDNDTLVQYVSTGETSFTFPFPILEASELKVSRNQVLLTYGADYSITGLGDDGGGYITLLAGASTPGQVFTLWQDMPIERLTGFSAGASTILGAALNAEFAARLRVEQQLRREIRNSLRIPPDDPESGTDMELPPSSTRAGKFLGFDALGLPTALSGTGNDSAFRTDVASSTAGADGSRLMGHRRGGVGAVARTARDKLVELITPWDFGAVGDDATDDTAALQRWLNAGAGGLGEGGTLLLPARRPSGARAMFRANGLVLASRTHVRGERGSMIKKNGGVGFTHIMDAVGTLGTPIATTANVAIGDTSCQVANAASFTVGGLAVLSEETFPFGSSGRRQEVLEVASIAGLVIGFTRRTVGAYLTANTARLTPFATEMRDIIVDGVGFQVPAGTDGGSLYFEYPYSCEARDIYSTGQKDHAGVTFWKGTFSKILGGLLENGASPATPGFGYGFIMASTSLFCEAIGVRTRNVRENAMSVGSKFCRIAHCFDVGAYDNSFNTHADGNEDCLIEHNVSLCSRGYGIVAGFSGSNAADKRITVRGNRIMYSGLHGIWSTADLTRENEDIVIEDNTIVRPGITTINQYGIEVIRGTRPRVANNVIIGQINNVRAGWRVEKSTKADVFGNKIADIPNGWGGIHEECTGITIERNKMAALAGGTQGVHATGVASTKVYVRGNNVDNDVAFTKNAGDFHEGNTYDTKRELDYGQSGVIADGATINHNCVSTPGNAHAQATIGGEMASVTARAAGTITIAIKKHDGTAGTAQAIDWTVRR